MIISFHGEALSLFLSWPREGVVAVRWARVVDHLRMNISSPPCANAILFLLFSIRWKSIFLFDFDFFSAYPLLYRWRFFCSFVRILLFLLLLSSVTGRRRVRCPLFLVVLIQLREFSFFLSPNVFWLPPFVRRTEFIHRRRTSLGWRKDYPPLY